MSLQNAAFEEVIDSLMMDESEPSYEALVRWSKRYPQFRDALMTFFAEWGLQSEIDTETDVDEIRLSNLAVSHALDLMHRRHTLTRNVQSVGALRLLKTAEGIGIAPEVLAQSVGLDVMLIRKLDLRRILDVPRHCIDALAKELRLLTEQVAEMIVGPPILSASVQHKSKRKPNATTEAFEDAVRNSMLTDHAKEFWLQVAKEEKEHRQE